MPHPKSLKANSSRSKKFRASQATESSSTSQSQEHQKTLSDSFRSSQSHAYSNDIAEESPSKRLKLNHTLMQQPREIVTANEMYNFARPNYIDLTNGDGPAPMTTVQKRSNGISRPITNASEAGPKRLVVKNLRKAPRSDPEAYVNHVWSQLDAALSAILVNEKLPFSNEELYRGAENLCRHGRAPSLYQTLHQRCKQGVAECFEQPLVAQASTADHEEILRAVVQAWQAWNDRLKIIRSIFFFLDRSYLLQSPSLPSIYEMGTQQFREQVFSNHVLKPRILYGACGLVAVDREGHRTVHGSDLLRKVIKMFHDLSVYTTDFEPELLGRSSSFISAWSDRQAKVLGLGDYIQEAQKLIHVELQRCDDFGLDETTRKSLGTYLEDLLVDQADRQKKLLDSTEISRLFEADARDTLKQLYDLLQRRDLCEKLRVPFEAYISDHGSQIVFDEAREQEMVSRLLEFKKDLDSIWRTCFARHEGLGHSLREAFESFINKSKRSNMTWGTDNPKPGEMIAKYVDMILKGGLRAISGRMPATKNANKEDMDVSSEDEDLEINKQLDQVLELFRFVHGKAVFEAFYKRDLARRLLLNRSASADAEKSMLTRLRSGELSSGCLILPAADFSIECGAGFTHNLEHMFKDMELARDEVASYKSMLEQRGSEISIDLNVSVLSASAWPSYPDVPLVIPREVQQAATIFEQHYKVKHTGRKLAWKHSLAHCQLKANLPKGNKELVVSSYQAVVLLLFQSHSTNDEISYAQIQAATDLSRLSTPHDTCFCSQLLLLDDVELKRTLQSLACARYRVLSKTPKGKDINNTDTFSINNAFSDAKYRIKINQIQAKETKEENKETHERVAADRAYETQAAIVRIMKGRKTITHLELVGEVIKATKSRGVLDAGDIKKNIERQVSDYCSIDVNIGHANRSTRLIEKEYMEREEIDGKNAYSYLA
ncbi:MAG: hypothetical protein Q9222_003991 [Ikaeria aurantiellina]